MSATEAEPGHTDGSIAFHFADSGTLFTGDVATENQGSVILGPFNHDREVPVPLG